jgi:thiol-disulfide isomerase/thioredoxin
MRVSHLWGLLAVLGLSACPAAEALLPVEREVAALAAGPAVTVVHFWAPWCPSCAFELAKGGWADFIGRNPKVNVVFVTVWHGGDEGGATVLAKHGVGPQRNFRLLHHPNGSRREEDRMHTFLGMPVPWLPATWVYRDGKLRYALNYGEVRFPILQQLVEDAADSWDR